MVKISGMAAKYNVFSSQIERVQNTIVQHHDQNTTRILLMLLVQTSFMVLSVRWSVVGRSVIIVI